jgi:hypothetical protein
MMARDVECEMPMNETAEMEKMMERWSASDKETSQLKKIEG